MTPLARRQPRAGLFATERPPRLVLRFAVVLALTLGVAAAAILLVVRHFAVTQAERAATRQAGVVASALLQREVTASDLAGTVNGARRAVLDALFGSHVVSGDTLGISLVRGDGLITYSTDHRLIGARSSGALASEASRGTIVSRPSSDGPAGATAGSKVLETFVPVAETAAGAAALVQSYEAIESDARALQLRVGAVLEALLLVLFVVFVPLLARVTQRIRRQIERIHAQAYYDELTGLPNRAHLRELLQTALARAADEGRRLAIVLLDLDRFREINNTLGHEAADELLRETAARLRETVGEEALLARADGDAFAVVSEETGDAEVTRLAERVREALDRPFLLGGVPVAVEGTAGIAAFPEDGAEAELLLKHAEVAVGTAKQWRVGVLPYSPSVDPHDPEQLALVAELRAAAESGDIVLHYQPKVELASGTVVGFEALSYWQHPSRGLLPPGAFVPIAERTGVIRHLTRAVLEGAVGQLQEWEDVGAGLTVSVNLSAVDLLDLELPERLETLLAEYATDPHRICLEITESAIMADPERARAVLDRLAAIGLKLSIDDFGTGYSSLAYLKHLPVHEVKIDKSFVLVMATSQSDRSIVRTTVELGHNLGLTVVAEGVETREVQRLLRGYACDVAQGYLFGRPQPAEQVTEQLSAGRVAAA